MTSYSRRGATAGVLACAAAIALGAGALTAVLPAFAFQVGLILGVAALVGAALWTASGRVLNPAWVIITWLYLVGPVGTLLIELGVGLQMAALAALAPVTFVAAALLTKPEARARLVLLGPLALLVFLSVLSLLWSDDPVYGATKLNLWVWTGVLPAACVLILAVASQRVSWPLIAVLALLSGLALIAFGTPDIDYPGRPTLLGQNPIWAARALFIGALVALFGPFPSAVRFVSAAVMIVAGLLTISLGPALGLAIGVWAGVGETFRCGNRVERRFLVIWVGLGVLMGIAVLSALAGSPDADTSLVTSLAKQEDVSSRQAFLGASLPLFAKSPLVGIGLGGFAATGLDTYPHNLFVEVGLELGPLGMTAFAGWLWLAIRGAAGSPLLMALVVATTVFTLFSGSIASNTEFWMFTALAVAMYPMARRLPAAPAPGSAPAQGAAPGAAPAAQAPAPGASR